MTDVLVTADEIISFSLYCKALKGDTCCEVGLHKSKLIDFQIGFSHKKVGLRELSLYSTKSSSIY